MSATAVPLRAGLQRLHQLQPGRSAAGRKARAWPHVWRPGARIDGPEDALRRADWRNRAQASPRDDRCVYRDRLARICQVGSRPPGTRRCLGTGQADRHRDAGRGSRMGASNRAVGLQRVALTGTGAAGVRRESASRADATSGSESQSPRAMRCPFCGSDDNQVKDSRPVEEGGAVRRRRQCNACGARFTTFERIQLRELTVIKRDGRRVPFDRDKLKRSIMIATRKRGIDEERIERLVNGIVREIEITGETEIDAKRLGALAMQRLAELDQVAYVRFASVYRDFTGVKDFEQFIARMAARSRPTRPPPQTRCRRRRPDERDDDRRFMALALRLAERGLGRTWPNPAVGCVRGQGRPGRRPRLDPAGRPAARRGRGAEAGRRRGARRHRLRHPRALRPLRPHAALHDGAAARRRAPGGGGDARPGPAGRRPRHRAAAPGRGRGRARPAARRGRGAERRLLPQGARRPAARHPEARDLARRPDRDPERRQPVAHRRGGARARPLAARDPRCDHDRQRHGARRRSGADLPPARPRGALAGAGRARRPRCACRRPAGSRRPRAQRADLAVHRRRRRAGARRRPCARRGSS